MGITTRIVCFFKKLIKCSPHPHDKYEFKFEREFKFGPNTRKTDIKEGDCEKFIFDVCTDSKNIEFPAELREFYYEKHKAGWSNADVKSHFMYTHTAKIIKGGNYQVEPLPYEESE